MVHQSRASDGYDNPLRNISSVSGSSMVDMRFEVEEESMSSSLSSEHLNESVVGVSGAEFAFNASSNAAVLCPLILPMLCPSIPPLGPVIS